MKDLEAGSDYSVEMINAARPEPNLVQYLEEIESFKIDMATICETFGRLQDRNEPLKASRNRINGVILKVLKEAKALRSKLEEMDQANEDNCVLPGYRASPPCDPARTLVNNGLKNQLTEFMIDFQELRQKISEYRELVGRRYFIVIEKIITGQDGGEDYLQSAIQEHGREKVLEAAADIKDRYHIAKDTENGLLELHHVFVDMFFMLEQQGEHSVSDYSVVMTNAAHLEPNLVQFLKEAEDVTTEMASIRDILGRLQDANKESKSLHKPEPLKAFFNKINGDIRTVLEKAGAIRYRIEEMNRANEDNRLLSGYRATTPIDPARTLVINDLRKKLMETMMDFQELWQKMMSEYLEMVGRKYFTVTGQNSNEDVIEKIVTSGENGGDNYLQSAIQEPHKSLLELHQLFFDMAVMVEVQGERVKRTKISFQGLPIELEDNIIKRIKDIRCLIRCKLVCKDWNERISSWVDKKCFLMYYKAAGLFYIASGEKKLLVPQPIISQNSYDAVERVRMIATKDGIVTLMNLPYLYHWKPCSGYLVRTRTPLMTEDVAVGIGFSADSPGLKVLILESLQRNANIEFFTAYCFGNKTWEPRMAINPLVDAYTILEGVQTPSKKGNFCWFVRGTSGSLSILKYNFGKNVFSSFEGPPNHSLESLPTLHFGLKNLVWVGFSSNSRVQSHVRRNGTWVLFKDYGFLPHPKMEFGVGPSVQALEFTVNEEELKIAIMEKGERIEIAKRKRV